MKKEKYLNRKIWNKIKLVLVMSAVVFALFQISVTTFWLIYVIFYKVPFIDIDNLPKHTNFYIFLALSLVVGIILSMVFKKYIIVPLHNSYLALDRVADGDFKVNVSENGIAPVRNIAQSVNFMAEELENIETMRNDFIDNFSHELKTPIASIAGFAKMLKNTELTEEEREEYLNIIISESERLSQLSVNVLNLTKLDNQIEVTDKTEFNVTEQIRHTVILLERKWMEKNIEIDFECQEYTVCANEELLSQVWINLLDNAIKFSPQNSVIRINIKDNGDAMSFTFADSGMGMDDKTVRHVFDKFFQGDINHKSKGYGIGLAITKRICELHKGSIKISKTDETGTVFEVVLPS